MFQDPAEFVGFPRLRSPAREKTFYRQTGKAKEAYHGLGLSERLEGDGSYSCNIHDASSRHADAHSHLRPGVWGDVGGNTERPVGRSYTGRANLYSQYGHWRPASCHCGCIWFLHGAEFVAGQV